MEAADKKLDEFIALSDSLSDVSQHDTATNSTVTQDMDADVHGSSSSSSNEVRQLN